MQHAYGRELHRVTEWRRVKRDDELDRQPPDEPRESRGRKRSKDGSEGKSFLGFTAAVLGLFRDKGYCAESETQIRKDGHRTYYPAPDIFAKLAASGFPAAMLACAAADVIPLNLMTRGGPSLDKKTSGEAMEDERRFIEGTLDPGIDEFIPPDENGLQTTRPITLCPERTPVHRVNFIGTTLDRKMVYYWRNHDQFKKAKALLARLVLEGLLAEKGLKREVKDLQNLSDGDLVKAMKNLCNAPAQENRSYVSKLANREFLKSLQKRRGSTQRILSPSE
jgi:hypothetical protein